MMLSPSSSSICFSSSPPSPLLLALSTPLPSAPAAAVAVRLTPAVQVHSAEVSHAPTDGLKDRDVLLDGNTTDTIKDEGPPSSSPVRLPRKRKRVDHHPPPPLSSGAAATAATVTTVTHATGSSSSLSSVASQQDSPSRARQSSSSSATTVRPPSLTLAPSERPQLPRMLEPVPELTRKICVACVKDHSKFATTPLPADHCATKQGTLSVSCMRCQGAKGDCRMIPLQFHRATNMLLELVRRYRRAPSDERARAVASYAKLWGAQHDHAVKQDAKYLKAGVVGGLEARAIEYRRSREYNYIRWKDGFGVDQSAPPANAVVDAEVEKVWFDGASEMDRDRIWRRGPLAEHRQ